MTEALKKERESQDSLDKNSTLALTVPGGEESCHSDECVFISLKSVKKDQDCNTQACDFNLWRSMITFNKDGKYYTPAFKEKIISFDTQLQDKCLKQIFRQKKRDYCRPKTQIMQPKPTHSFCHVCQEHFLDYWKHISNELHIRRLHDSPFDGIIEELCKSVNRKVRARPSGKKQQFSCGESSRKKIKMDSDFSQTSQTVNKSDETSFKPFSDEIFSI